MHLSEAQFFCPGLQLLVSALGVGGETRAWLQPSGRGMGAGRQREGKPSQMEICECEFT